MSGTVLLCIVTISPAYITPETGSINNIPICVLIIVRIWFIMIVYNVYGKEIVS